MKSFRSLWLRAGTLTFASILLGAGTAFAAAPNQEQVNPSNNTALMALAGVLIALVLALVGGAVIAEAGTVWLALLPPQPAHR